MPTDTLDVARRDAIHLLCMAQADGRISVDLFHQRYLLLQEAPSAAAARQLVGDLEPSGTFAPAPVTGEDALAPLSPAPVAPLEQLRLSAVFSSVKRSGQWTVPLLIETKCLFGSLRLDFRDAWFDADTLDIHVDAICGSLELIVPPGTQVENAVEETMSGSKHKRSRGAPVELNGLLVRLSGWMFMSGLKIIERPPTGQETGLLGAVRRRLRA
jgi:hypothetical protein